MQRQYQKDRDGFCVLSFVNTKKDTEDILIEIDTICSDDGHIDNNGHDNENDAGDNDDEHQTQTIIEEDEGDISGTPLVLYGKKQSKNEIIEDEYYDGEEVPNSNENICFQITIPTIPPPTVGDLKKKFLNAMSEKSNIRDVCIYKVSFLANPKIEDLKDEDIPLSGGRIGRLLEPDTENLNVFNIQAGDFFELEI